MGHSELEEAHQDYALLEKHFQQVVKKLNTLKEEHYALKVKCMKLEEDKEFFRKSLEYQNKERLKKKRPF